MSSSSTRTWDSKQQASQGVQYYCSGILGSVSLIQPSAPLVVIRELSAGDIEPFSRWRGGDDDYTRAILAIHLGEHAEARRCIFVAVDGDRLVGTAQLVREQPEADLANGRDIGYVEAVQIVPEYQRQGIATRLMAALEARARRLGIKRLTLMVEPDNVPAIGLYRALGYKAFRRGTWHWRGTRHPTICMAKILS